VRVYRGRALRGLPGILRGLVRHLAEQVVMRECGEEILDALAEDRLVRGRDTAMELDPAADEQGVVGDLLDHRVLEAVAALAPLAGSRFEDQVGRDELIDGVRNSRAAGLAEDAVAEALPDHRCELDRFLRARWQAIDARGDDPVERCRHLQRGGPLAQLPFALLVLRDSARIHERADGLLDEERVATGPRDDFVAELVGDPVESCVDDPRRFLIGERLEDELAEVRPHRSRLW